MALVAPLYFHFGHYWFAIEVITIVQEMADVIAFFFLAIAITGSIVLYRNIMFQVLNSSFFKNYFSVSNRLPLLNYFSIFYNSFVNSVTFVVSKIYYFLKSSK